MRVVVIFEADPGVTWEQAYDAAEAMVTAAPEMTGHALTFQSIEVER